MNTPDLLVASDSVAQSLLVDLRSLDSTIVIEARYATADNFTGAPIPGYDVNRAFLRREAALALARAQRRARAEGLALKVWDGYRPVRATVAPRATSLRWARRSTHSPRPRTPPMLAVQSPPTGDVSSA